jgi:hypothetical protein
MGGLMHKDAHHTAKTVRAVIRSRLTQSRCPLRRTPAIEQPRNGTLRLAAPAFDGHRAVERAVHAADPLAGNVLEFKL